MVDWDRVCWVNLLDKTYSYLHALLRHRHPPDKEDKNIQEILIIYTRNLPLVRTLVATCKVTRSSCLFLLVLVSRNSPVVNVYIMI